MERPRAPERPGASEHPGASERRAEIERFYRFHVRPGSTVLHVGCGAGDLLASLEPSRGVGIDSSEERIRRARARHPDLEFVCADAERFSADGTFEYVVVSDVPDRLDDVQAFLTRLSRFFTPETRLLLDWRLRPRGRARNRLSAEAVRNLLEIAGYEVLHEESRTLVPWRLTPLSTAANRFFARLPLLGRLCLTGHVVARRPPPPRNPDNATATVVVTCRDERENIEPLVLRTPRMGRRTEIIFVEGHSVDGTREEIERVIRAHPEREIRLVVQDGIGQGDAFRKGFALAEGDLVLWLEADLTTPPEELEKFWQVYLAGRGEYLNGTRLVYEMAEGAMPLVNRLGNRLFGILLTRILRRRFTDTLCGLKAISKRNFDRIREERVFFGDFDPFGDFELIFGAVKNDLKVVEIPVRYYPRSYGATKTRPFSHGRLLMRMCWIALKRFRFS